jgi:DNA-binding MarR family transcriptional regulator
MDNVRRQRTEETVAQLRRLLLGAQSATAPAWLELPVTIGQLRCLFALEHAGTSCVGDLAKRLGVGAPATSVMVDQLVGLGYIERRTDPTDRRRHLLGVTPAAGELLSGLRHDRQEVIEAWLADLSDSELEALWTAMRPLERSILAKMSVPSSMTAEPTDAASSATAVGSSGP